MRVSFIEALGARTRYYHAGSGPPVLLVHGVGMCADSWIHTVPALAERFTVYAPDLLDNGFTERGPYEGGPPQPYMVDHLIALADALGLERFSLVGSSLGSAIAILTALRCPERVDRLVLVGPGTTMSPPDLSGNAFCASYINGRAAILEPTYEACRARIARIVFDPACIPDILPLMQMTMYALPGALESFERRLAGLRDVAGLQRYNAHAALEQLHGPTLVLVGRDDQRGHFGETMEAAARLPNKQVVVYERCGHWPHMEHPEQFNRDVMAFLGAQQEIEA
jgi:pimeloyl-ACP methyl ester carboxylesterase